MLAALPNPTSTAVPSSTTSSSSPHSNQSNRNVKVAPFPPLPPTTLSRPSALATQFSLMFTFKRLFIPLLAPPFLYYAIPKVISIVSCILNYICGGYTLLIVALTYTVIKSVHAQIGRYAPSTEKRDVAISSLGIRFQLLVFFTSSYLIRWGMSYYGMNHHMTSMTYLMRMQFLNISVGFRFAMALLSLSILVGSRFTGYFSVVHCATFPLPQNPYQVILRNMPSFASKYFHQAFKPDSVKQQQKQQRQSNEPTTGPRQSSIPSLSSKKYSKPSIIQSSLQLICHLVGGLLFSRIILSDFIQFLSLDTQCSTTDTDTDSTTMTITSQVQMFFTVSCTLMSMMTYLIIYLPKYNESMISFPEMPWQLLSSSSTTAPKSPYAISNYHELSFDKKTLPYVSISSLFRIIKDEMMQQLFTSGILFYWFISPLLSWTILYFIGFKDWNICNGEGGEDRPRSAIIWTIFTSCAITLFMLLYIMFIDILTRKSLQTQGLNVHKLVTRSNIDMELLQGRKDENTFDTSNEVVVESLVVNIILAGVGKGTINDVLAPRMIQQGDKFVRPMKRKRNESGYSWAPSTDLICGNVDLEVEEVRRNNLMIDRVASSIISGSIGDYSIFEEGLLKFMILESFGGGEDVSILSEMELSDRHYKTISRYLNTIYQSPASTEVLSIVRALCAYAGGVGKALERIPFFEPPQVTDVSEGRIAFVFQPNAAISVGNAIKAAERFLLLNMMNRRFSRLSLLTSVVLQSTHQLYNGVLEFGHYLFNQNDVQGENIEGFLSINHPELFALAQTCKNVSVRILKCMQTLDDQTSFEVTGIKVDNNVKEWLYSLLRD